MSQFGIGDVFEPRKCPDEASYQYLTAPPSLDADQKQQVQSLLKGIPTDSYSSILFKTKPFLQLDSKYTRSLFVNTFAISVGDVKQKNRDYAVEGLLEAKRFPQFKMLIEDIAQHYPIQAIRERAAQILAAPELPNGCSFILIPLEPWNFIS